MPKEKKVPIDVLNPFTLTQTFTDATRDATFPNPPDDLIILNIETGTWQRYGPSGWENIGTFILDRDDGDTVVWNETTGAFEAVPIPSLYDAFVDSTYAGSVPWIHSTLAAAIAAGAASIAVKDTGDVAAITIAAGDAVQRIQGKDADTTLLPVNVTVTKDNVTIEQFELSTTTLTIAPPGGGVSSVREMLATATGRISVTNNPSVVILDRVRAAGFTATPILLASNFSHVRGSQFVGGTGASTRAIEVTTSITTCSIEDCTILAITSSSVYAVAATHADGVIQGTISRNFIRALGTAGGGISWIGREGRIENNTLIAGSALNAGVRLLSVESPSGFNIDTQVINNLLIGTTAADGLFECASADADAAGLVMIGNTFRTGTVLFSQDSMWTANDFAGCTLDFQSKTGIRITDGDMTGCTLQNVPNDITFRNVKGQNDRGPFWDAVHSHGDTAPACRVERTAPVQSISDNAVTNISFNLEVFDNDGLWAAAPNPTRVTAARPDKYHFSYTVPFDTNATGIRLARVVKNNAATIEDEDRKTADATTFTVCSGSGEVHLNAGDYLELRAYQNSGAPLNTVSSFGVNCKLIVRAMGSKA